MVFHRIYESVELGNASFVQQPPSKLVAPLVIHSTEPSRDGQLIQSVGVVALQLTPRCTRWTAVAFTRAVTVEPDATCNSSSDGLVISAVSAKPQSIVTRTTLPSDCSATTRPVHWFRALTSPCFDRSRMTSSARMQTKTGPGATSAAALIDPSRTRTVARPLAVSTTVPATTFSTPTDAATATSTGRLKTSGTDPTCRMNPPESTAIRSPSVRASTRS